jgi:2-C-methyl-D-erythritol 4-phosphate cytidylyltransferase
VKKNCALIVAAGKGTRMGTEVKKQFIEIKGNPVLYYTLKAFSDCELISDIFLVLSKDDINYCEKHILQKYKFSKKIHIVEGGEQRQESVYNGLKAIGNCDIVLIHDGARPFISGDVIKAGITFAQKHGACACGVVPKDTIKIRDNEGFSVSTPDRSFLFAVQTPQCFKYSLIMECHEDIKADSSLATDDTMIVEKYGHKVFLFEGDYKNIKITTPEDIITAEGILKEINQ